MGSLIYLGIFLASLDPTYEDASNTARRALLETSMMKEELKSIQAGAERNLYRFTGLTKDDVIWGAYIYPVAAGRVSTKPFKNFRHKTECGWIFRPELEYQFSNQEYSTYLFITKEF